MPKKRLFIKMVITYFCIGLSTLTVLGVLLSFLVNNYLVYNKQMEMLVRTSDIARLIQPYLIAKEDPAQLIGLLNQSDKNLGTEIWVIDSQGRVIAAAANQKAHEGDLIEMADLDRMRQGEVSIREGKSQIYKDSVMWVIVPIEETGRVIGGLIMYTPILGVAQTIAKIRNLFIYSALVSIVFSTVIVYFLAKYVTGPLQQMNRVAKQLAGGNLSERVDINQGDEIGDLGEAFNHMASQIERQEKMRRGFVADVSHELRSPLTNIQGFIEAMMDGKDKTSEDRSRYLGIIHKETLRLTRLVNELLDLSKLEADLKPTYDQPVDLEEVIRGSAARMAPLLADKSVQLNLEMPGEEVVVKGDGDRLDQVMTNLLDNAVRYSPPGQAVTVSLRLNGENAEVTVTDRGPGIPEEDLPFIWERFYKADKSRCREAGGTGLGLAIVRRIVESHGGQVTAACGPEGGTSIGIVLPA